MSRTLSWFSCGAASAIATKLAIADGLVTPVYCDTGAEHVDNARFMRDCEEWFGQRVTVLRSDEYRDTWDVWEKRKYLAGISGAPCTSELKIAPRLAFQMPTDVHVFGYTADASDVARSERLREHYPELTIRTPLIERGLTKAACLSMLERARIRPPIVYALGFKNANCIPCVKATSASYWALVRLRFPIEFCRMAELSRRLNVRLARIGEDRVFIDDIPMDHPSDDPISPSCDFLCHIAEQDLQ